MRREAKIIGILVVVCFINDINVSGGFAAFIAQAMPDQRRHDHHDGSRSANSDDLSGALRGRRVPTVPEYKLDVATDPDKVVDLTRMGVPISDGAGMAIMRHLT